MLRDRLLNRKPAAPVDGCQKGEAYAQRRLNARPIAFSARHYGREALTLENVKMPTPSRPSTGLLFGSVLIESVSPSMV